MTPAHRTVHRLAALNLALMTGFPLLIAGAAAHVRGLVVAGAVLLGLLAVEMIVLAPIALARDAASGRGR
jgi:hypothetical protein